MTGIVFAVSLYQFIVVNFRYNSLPVFRRQAFGYEEDTLLSIVLHNVLIFLLMVGISPGETMDICHRISARTRLATVEEKLLQVTMNELEKAVSLNSTHTPMWAMLSNRTEITESSILVI